uniref:Uncharacterized protein n=1 Tax=Romanomermis culicivorax TaxID=13658 RepID=A0A915I222_ROMCU
NLQRNWTTDGRRYVLKRIDCRSEASKGVYCIQYDDDKIVAGLRDDSIRVSLL